MVIEKKKSSKKEGKEKITMKKEKGKESERHCCKRKGLKIANLMENYFL